MAHVTWFGYVANRYVTVECDGIRVVVEACFDSFDVYAECPRKLQFTANSLVDLEFASDWVDVNVDGSAKQYRSAATDADSLRDWLTTGLGALLDRQELHGAERIESFCGRVHFMCSMNRSLEDAALFVAKLCKSLPDATIVPASLEPGELVVDGLRFNESKLAEDLKPLAPFVPKWAVGDDKVRERKIARASKRAKKMLIETVQPLFPAINAYLDRFGDALPDEAILIGNVAEAAAEILAQPKQCGS